MKLLDNRASRWRRQCAGLLTPHAARAGTMTGVRIASKTMPS